MVSIPPERGQRCATEATERLRELAGDTVRLEDGPRLTDTYGRTLAYVYTVDGISIDAVLIQYRVFAKPYRGWPALLHSAGSFDNRAP